MRTVYWLFVVSVGLFIAGIGFILAGARAAPSAPAPAEAPTTTPVASVRQIMNGIVGPAATVIFDSVGTVITVDGIEETRPRTDQEWEAVGNSAAALAEAGNLLMLGDRAVDRGQWGEMSRALIDAGSVAVKATEDQNVEDLFTAGEIVNRSCDECHQQYLRQ